jgi:hypothetical protein
LNSAINRAYAESLVRAEADAKANSPSSKAGVSLVGNSLVPTGLGTVFEKGRHGGYDIAPTHAQALKIGTGFAAFAKGGPMAAEPYIRPAAYRWANGGFQSTARVTLASAGF